VRQAVALIAAAATFGVCFLVTWVIGEPAVLFSGLILPAAVYGGIMEES
jgi:hypothetical protein